jgi:class 3 adenylate cyclase
LNKVLEESPLEAGREAIARRAWREAFDLLTQADQTQELGSDDLTSLAEAAWWSGRLDDCISARERAFSGHLNAGRRLAAAMVAMDLSDDYFAKRANSIGAGWFNRAERLLEEEPEGIEHGYLATRHARGALISGDSHLAHPAAEKALEIGMRFGDRDLQALALLLQGNVLVAEGDMDGGLKLLDEAIVAAVSGELRPQAAGIVYCIAISTTAELGDYDRAGQWTEASTRWCERQSISGFPGICRVHRAEIMRLRGSWLEAEQEARRALAELQNFNLEFAAAGFYEVGEIRLRMGDLNGAEDAFRQAHELGREPQPGLAQLKLAEGKPQAAFSSMKRALEDPMLDALNRARLLPAMVEISIAVDELDAARAAIKDFEGIVQIYNSDSLKASYLCSLGALLLGEGAAAEAARTLKRSWRLWNQCDLPYEAARSRLALGAALRADGDEDAAVLEIRAAKVAFEKLGAVIDVRRALDLLGEESDESLPRSLAQVARMIKTFMFTDIVGSTRLVEAMGERRWSKMLSWHDRTLRELFAKHHGEEVKQLGDGFFVAFDTTNDAIECAVGIQRRLEEHSEVAGFAPDVRIGLHRTEATRKGTDYEGKGVHEAARVGALAQPGEIVASDAAVSDAASRFPISELRAVEVKGISEPMLVASIDSN